MEIKPIGIIHSPFAKADGTPIQPVFATGTTGRVEIYEPYREGLKDLEGFERIWLIYSFHEASKPKLILAPYMDKDEHGLFATRAPARPNPIGMSCVKLTKVEIGKLLIEDVDILDGTPLLDIKPYVPQLDCYLVKKYGWLEKINWEGKRANSRFFKCKQ